MTQICFNCDAVMVNNMMHNCIKGITDNINSLREKIDKLGQNKLDHLDGLTYALELIEGLEYQYKARGYDYKDQDVDPFHDIKNKIRMHLGLRLVAR